HASLALGAIDAADGRRHRRDRRGLLSVEGRRVKRDEPSFTWMHRLRLAPAVTLVLMASPGSAQAHLVTTGLGPVYDGLVHFALAPEDLVPVLALAAFAGLR